MDQEKAKRKKRVYHILMIVNVILIVALVAYYGYRLVYYYRLEHQPAEEVKLLSDKIIKDHEIVTSGSGLYQDENQEMYYFRGEEVGNYLSYSGQLWRIMKIEEDGSIVLILDQVLSAITYGDENLYETSAMRSYLNTSDTAYSGLVASMLNEPDTYLTMTKICLDEIVNIGNITCEKTMEDQVGLLNLSDYELSGGKNGYLNTGISYYTTTTDADGGLYYIYSQGGATVSNDFMEHNYGVRPTITLKPNLDYISGTGTMDDPYRIERTSQQLSIGSYVQYSGETFRIICKTENSYLLALTHLLTDEAGTTELFTYHTRSNAFEPNRYGSVAYTLNHNWVANIDPTLLVEGPWYTGDYSLNGSTDYRNIYTDSVTASVGLLNVGDFYSLDIPNTWLMTRLEDEEMVYTVDEDQKYYLDFISNEHGVRPAIYLTDQIQVLSGTGIDTDPYVVGGKE